MFWKLVINLVKCVVAGLKRAKPPVWSSNVEADPRLEFLFSFFFSRF